MTALWWVSVASAADWTATWAGSRWHLQVEETTASGVTLAAEENLSFRTRAIQVAAVVRCPTVEPNGKHTAFVYCNFDELALRATPRSADAAEALSGSNTKVLQDVVRRMASSRIELTVDDEGRITAVDLPDLKGGTRWESESRETLRRVAWDLVAGLSLRRPDDWRGGWVEKNTPVLRPPLEPGSMGLSKTEHVFTLVEGRSVVASDGRGSFTAAYVPWESSYSGKSVQQNGASGGATRDANNSIVGVTADRSGQMSEARPGQLAATPTDMTLSGELRSIALFDEADRLVERIYTMAARPTASSVGNMQGFSVTTNAHVRRLADDEPAPSVGAITVVAPRGTVIDGIPTWEPIPTF